MSQRKQALGRIWTLAWIYTVGMVLSFIILIVAVAWAIVDILWQLISGRNTFSEDSAPAQYVSRTYMWIAGQTVYSFTGGGDGRWKALP